MAFALSKEELAVLDDAVAFVAAWDNSTDEMATDSDPSLSPSDSSDRPTESPLPVTPTKTPSHRKRISNRTTMKHANTRGAHEAAGPQRPPPPKTRVAELIELRQQVVELETRLARLQKRRGSRTTEPRRFAAPRNESGRTRVLDSQKHDHNAPPSEHRNDAVMALEQLQQSETLNLKLKRAVETHEKISKRIESIFLKQTMNRDLAYLLEMERRLPREYMPSDRDVREEARIVQDLYHTLNANFYKTASMMASISAQDMRRVFSTSGLKQTPLYGRVFEVSTNTPVPCSIEQLDYYMWSRYGNLSESPNCDRVGQSFYEKPIKIHYSSPRGGINVEGVSMLCKFVNDSRIVVVMGSQLRVLGTELLFRENVWAILSDITRDTKNYGNPCQRRQTVLQTHYQVSCERGATNSGAAGTSLCNGQRSYLSGYVQHALSERMRELQLLIQSTLLQDIASVEAGGVIMLPPLLTAVAPC